VTSIDVSPKRLIVIGTSTGGLDALRTLVTGFSSEIAAAILVVQHIGAHKSRLAELLQACCPLPVRFAVDMEPLREGHILIAPADHHLIAHETHVRTMHTAKENYARPAIDPLFRTAAGRHLSSVIGVVLTGDLDDGTAGLRAIKDAGGVAVVQDPRTAVAPSMPESALRHVDVDYCLPLEAIAEKLMQLAIEPPCRRSTTVSETTMVENLFADGEGAAEDLDRVANRSMITCPECHGTLWQMKDASPPRFRCHTGHSYTQRHLTYVQAEALEKALWSAIRSLHEEQLLYEQLQHAALEAGRHVSAAEYADLAMQTEKRAKILKELNAVTRTASTESS
jgi:two-component system chemotaxis response regulator CheB